jgi:tetratricopeptide (TPR) repeat protein
VEALLREPDQAAVPAQTHAWFVAQRLMIFLGDIGAARGLHERLERLARGLDEASPARPWVHAARIYWHTYLEWDPARALESCVMAARLVGRAGDTMNQRIATLHQGWALLALGAYEEAERILSAVVAATDSHRLTQALARLFLGRGLAGQGRLAEAATTELGAHERFTAASSPIFLGLSEAALAEIALTEGDLETAVRRARTAFELVRRSPPIHASIAGLLAEIELGRGDAAAALGVAEPPAEVCVSLGITFDGQIRLELALSESLRALGRLEEADRKRASARARVSAAAAGIEDPALRGSFVTRVVENARVLA